MSRFLKLLKIIGIFIVFLAAILVAISMYENYDASEKKKAELRFDTDQTWGWHDEYQKIQIRYDKDSDATLLRKVDFNEGYVVLAYKDNDYKLHTAIKFITRCRPESKIETSKRYSNGEHIVLVCHKGNGLIYGVDWNQSDTNFVWSEDIDGFKFNVNFSAWDFRKLDQQITLRKAK